MTNREPTVVYDGSVIGPLCRDLKRLRPVAQWYYQDLIDLKADPDKGIPARYYPPGLWACAIGGSGRPWMYRYPYPHHPMEILASQRGYGGRENEIPPDSQLFVSEDSLESMKSIRIGSWVERADIMGAFQFLTPAQSRYIMHLFTPVTGNIWFDPKAEADVLMRQELYHAAGLGRPWAKANGAASAAIYNTTRRLDIWAGLTFDSCETLVVRI